jgi:coenzyme F420-dependent glucose-6-phosphate dehydrogenase
MPELGFALSSEDHPPNELVHQAALAERAGFTFALISNHYHPWVDAQAQAVRLVDARRDR